jgi:CRISPR-associated protein Cas5/CasD subtype I-E
MSFGEGDYWDIRSTGIFPTKSAIVGILAACFGWSRNDTEQIKELSESLSVSMRQDNRFSLLRDYHTILNTLKADGKPNENAVQSYRSYLMEAEFSVLVSSKSDKLHSKIKSALENPEWPVFLGRKSCSPSLPIYWGEEMNVENAQRGFEKLSLLGIERKKKFPEWFKKVSDKQELFACITDEKIANPDAKKSLIRDNIINSRLRVFSFRETYKFFVKVNV